MLRISQETSRELENRVFADFRARLVKALRTVFPEATAKKPDKELDALAAAAVRKSEAYGLELEYTIWSVLACMFVFGESFDIDPKQPWAHGLLDDPVLDEDSLSKLLALRVYMKSGKTI